MRLLLLVLLLVGCTVDRALGPQQPEMGPQCTCVKFMCPDAGSE